MSDLPPSFGVLESLLDVPTGSDDPFDHIDSTAHPSNDVSENLEPVSASPIQANNSILQDIITSPQASAANFDSTAADSDGSIPDASNNIDDPIEEIDNPAPSNNKSEPIDSALPTDFVPSPPNLSAPSAASLFADDGEDTPFEIDVGDIADSPDTATFMEPKGADDLITAEVGGTDIPIAPLNLETHPITTELEANNKIGEQPEESVRDSAKSTPTLNPGDPETNDSNGPDDHIEIPVLTRDDESQSFDSTLQDTAAISSIPQPSASTVSALFTNAAFDIAFDIEESFEIDQSDYAADLNMSTPSDQHVASAAGIEHLQASPSDWLVDTSVDDSIDLGRGEHQHVQDEYELKSPTTDGGDETIPFEVPEGWYDDNGDWHWYTDDEREQVRRAMMASTSSSNDVWAGSFDTIAASAEYVPPVGVSENMARRTPISADTLPDSPAAYSYVQDQYLYNPETVAAPSSELYGPTSSTSFQTSLHPTREDSTTAPSTYTPIAAGYPQSSKSPQTTATNVSSYVPGYSSAYDPYAPTAQSYTSTYAPTLPTPAAPSSATSSSQVKPPPPKRAASNAYDPPFLKPQKSFIRPTIALPAAAGFVTPHSSTVQDTFGPPVSNPLPPTVTGPPKRVKPTVAAHYVPPPPAPVRDFVREAISVGNEHGDYNLPVSDSVIIDQTLPLQQPQGMEHKQAGDDATHSHGQLQHQQSYEPHSESSHVEYIPSQAAYEPSSNQYEPFHGGYEPSGSRHEPVHGDYEPSLGSPPLPTSLGFPEPPRSSSKPPPRPASTVSAVPPPKSTSFDPPLRPATSRPASRPTYVPAPTHPISPHLVDISSSLSATARAITPTPMDALYGPVVDSYGRAITPANVSEYGISPPAPNYFLSIGSSADPTYVPQQVLEQRPVTEDPLGRCTMAARNVPIASFGFGGYLVAGFPASVEDVSSAAVSSSHSRTPSYGYASGRGQLWIRNVSNVVESSALKANEVPFPGPLILDSSTPRGATGDKKRREAVLTYLAARADEIERGLPYLKSSANRARREQEGQLVIVHILTALIHGDGRLFGSPQAEEAIRIALQPPASSLTSPATSVLLTTSALTGAATAVNALSVKPVATLAQLEHLSSLILLGDKRDAALYAASAGLWAHALVISSSVDPELWGEVVNRFSASELASHPNMAGIKAAYSIFSGLPAGKVDNLFEAANITEDPSADRWREVVAGVLFNGKPTDLTCLDELGDKFTRAGLLNVGQVCYLLSPNSPFSDLSTAAFERPIMLVENARDEDGAIFAEIAEYARSLVPTPKGMEVPSPSLPQLLPYKLQRAWRAAELGEVEQSRRYCDAIDAATKAGPKGATSAASLLSRHLVTSMEDLIERLTGSPSIAPSGGLGMRKTKSGATLGSWIEGRLTKFIAGEDENGEKPTAVAATATAGSIPVGPFSHFSSISPAASGSITRAPSTSDLLPSPRPATQPLAPIDHRRAYTEPYGSVYTPSGSTFDQPSSSYMSWGDNAESIPDAEATPHAVPFHGTDDDVEIINPMAQLSLGTSVVSEYGTSSSLKQSTWEDDADDDLGFGNTSLSRARTPKVSTANADSDSRTTGDEHKVEAKAEPAGSSPAKAEGKSSGWLRGWFAKKEGESTGPIRAKLGEESSMIYDPELKRWVVKGAKGETSIPTPTPPPPRAHTASPSGTQRQEQNARALSATPPAGPGQRDAILPPRNLTMSTNMPPPPSTAPPGALGPPPARPPSSRPPSARPATAATGASLDDLLTRPPSARRTQSSALKKGARNRYVDVFQPGAE